MLQFLEPQSEGLQSLDRLAESGPLEEYSCILRVSLLGFLLQALAVVGIVGYIEVEVALEVVVGAEALDTPLVPLVISVA